MKTLVILVTAIITLPGSLNINVSAQIIDSLSPSSNSQALVTQYLKKSHSQKVTSNIMALTGGAIGITGIVLAAASLNGNGLFDPNARQNAYGSAPDILAIGGAALIVAALPFAHESRKNKNKARFYMHKEQVLIIPKIKSIELASVGIKISL